MVILYLLLVLLIWLLYWALYCRPRELLWSMAKELPGPKPYPFIGNCLLLGHPDMSVTLQVIIDLFKEYGPVVRLWFTDKLNVLLLHPDDIQQVLGNPKIRNRDYRISLAAAPFLGSGLFTSRDDLWKMHRKLATPMFHFEILQSYITVFGEKSRILVEQLETLADGRSFDVYTHLTLCTLDTICETVIGSSIDSQQEGYNSLQKSIQQITELIHFRMSLFSVLPEWMHWTVWNGSSTRQCIKAINKCFAKVSSSKREEYRSGSISSFVTASGKTIRSSLDIFLETSELQGSVLSARDIQDQIVTLIGAGTETTATAMAFLLLLVAIHPDIQNQLVVELEGIFGDNPRPANRDDIKRMHVLDRVIRETLRHFPIGTFLGREISEDLLLPSGHTLPRGSTVMIATYAVHMNEEFYQEPNKFWPDRWLPENSPPRHPYAYLPFSAGARNCIGQKYSLLQMKTVVSTLLRRFTVNTDYTMKELKQLKLTVLMTLAGHNKYQIRLEKRKPLDC